ncbi:MAG: PcfB family protein [Bacilli bacterium]|nr:PcfB family protein [Bacilli bacterium]
MNSSESAELAVKIGIEGAEAALRIAGQCTERLAVAIYTILKDQKMTKGKTKLNNMLKSGSPLQIFSLQEDQLKKFHELSKQYGILYTALINKKDKNNDGMVDIMVRDYDAPKVNRIVQRFKLSAIDIASIKSEVEKDKMEELLNDAKERGVKVKTFEEELADDILSKPKQKEDNEVSNPQEAMTEKSPQSEPSSENKSNSGVVSNKKKPSVREALKKIKDELKTKELRNEDKEAIKNGKDVTIIDTDKKKTTNYVDTKKGIKKTTTKWKKGKER